jgi:alpha-tubulin suppressor-like RCC1 family protein
LWCGGQNYQGQLGTGNTSKSDPGQNSGYIGELTQVGALTNWSKVAANYQSSYAVKTDGTLWAWGYNNGGELGTNNTTSYSSPVQVGALNTWSILSTTGGIGTTRHVAAIKTDGTLWMWGFNDHGQLGLGDITARSSPTQVGSGTGWSSAHASWSRTAAISS